MKMLEFFLEKYYLVYVLRLKTKHHQTAQTNFFVCPNLSKYVRLYEKNMEIEIDNITIFSYKMCCMSVVKDRSVKKL
jgi:hypothetical protein